MEPIRFRNSVPKRDVLESELQRPDFLATLGEALTAWGERAIPGGFMATDDVGVALAEVLATVLTHPGIDLCDVQFDARRPN